ncbi:MAG TPA: TonB-dependent receptor [Bacteroidales bacterium]|jgi:TonB-linked SusC/RagA family outer membrane protein|nr:TonB-dependent receptor [Bacteroidales bacterium]
MKKELISVLLFLLINPLYILAQDYSVSGKIVDNNNTPLPGVTIQIKNANEGTISDLNGDFNINAPINSVLIISMVGMIEQEYYISGDTLLQIILEEDISLFEEVVVIGYGTVKKSDLTGAVGTVKSKDLVKITSINPVQSLQGKATGVQITSTSGAPGANPVVRIRGIGTFNDNSPIYVVDGVISNDISFLNAADIESTEILKDASATAIYGSRGSNGVILITTKTGKKGQKQTTFNYNGEYGIQQITKKIELLNGKEFAEVSNRIKFEYNNPDLLPNTDWQELIFQPAAITNHQFSFSGSSERNLFYLSVGYYKQDGIIDKSGYERITFRTNNTYQVTDFLKIGNNLGITPFKQQNAPNVTYQAYRASPILEPYRADGSFAGVPGVGNPLANLAYSNNFDKGIRAVGNLFVEATILQSFTAKSSFGLDGLYKKSLNFTPAYTVLYYDGSESLQTNPTSDLSKGTTENLTWLWENTLNYTKEFNKHSINAVAGFTMQNSSSEILRISGENILRDSEDFWYLQPNYITSNTINSFENSVDAGLNYSMVSFLFRGNYTYNKRYILTATFRRDGSSKFAKENRFGNFPSFAAGWNISEETFMQNLTAVTGLKIRASWGKIGNEKINYSDRFSLTENLLAVFGPGDISYSAVSYGRSGNPDLKWETTTQTDIGLDMALFGGKLTGEFDYYRRVTDDILVELSTPGHQGNGQGQKVRYNAGSVLNYGFEANINWRQRRGDFSYSVGVLATTVHNEVLSIGGNSGVDSLLFGGNVNGFVTQSRKGLPLGAFYGYKTDGLFQTQSDLDAYPHTSDAGPGDLRRVDVNNDGRIDGQDRTYLGSPIPKFIFGFNVELTYKNFDFSMNIQGQTGNKILNGKEIVRPDEYNFEKHVIDGWTGPGTSNSEPRNSWGGYNFVTSDRFIQDGSFIRLRNIIFGYTVPANITSKAKINSLRVYVKGDNIFTFSKFTGYTPEIASSDPLANAIDMGTYPIPAIYSIGINLTF